MGLVASRTAVGELRACCLRPATLTKASSVCPEGNSTQSLAPLMQDFDISARTNIHETRHFKYDSALYTKTRQFWALSMIVQLVGRTRWRSCQARLLVPPPTDR